MIVDGKALSEELKKKIQKEVKKFKVAPKLLVFSAGKNPANDSYIKRKNAFAEEVGITLKHIRLPGSSQKKAKATLLDTLQKEKPDGAIIQIPVPKSWDVDKLINLLPAHLDVDCLGLGRKYFLSPVLLSIQEILRKNHVNAKGKNVVVIGAGRLVGAPAASYFKKAGAKVTICDIHTKNIPAITKKADILVSGAGSAHIITPRMVKTGVVALDVGFALKDGKIQGDIDPGVSEKAFLYSPVPGGIGGMTVAFLFSNVVKAKKRQNRAKN